MQGLSLLLGRTGRIPNRTVSPGRCSSAAGHSGETTSLKSVVLPALAHQPLSPRVQLKLTELRGRNSLRTLYSIPVVRSLVIGATIEWMYGHVTAGRRPANRAQQFRMGLTQAGASRQRVSVSADSPVPGLTPAVPPLASGSWVRYYPRPRRESVTVLKGLTLSATFPAVYIGDSRKRDACPDGPPWLRERGFASPHRLT